MQETTVYVTFKVDGFGASTELDIVTSDGAVFSYSHNKNGFQPKPNEFRDLLDGQETVKVDLKEEQTQEYLTEYSAVQYQFPLKNLGIDFTHYIQRYMQNVHFKVPLGGKRPDSNFRLF